MHFQFLKFKLVFLSPQHTREKKSCYYLFIKTKLYIKLNLEIKTNCIYKPKVFYPRSS